MIIKSAEFLISNKDIKKCPEPDKPEYAFIGRSNVGKSSLINMITGKKSLAKTSSTPGKTRLVNHFIINEEWYLVDLPGLGFAKTSKKEKSGWENMISDYLLHRENLLNTFVLIDSRLAPQKIDIEFINWMGGHSLPFVIVFTKTDKNTRNILHKNVQHYKKFLQKYWEELPPVFITSSENKTGREEILKFIKETNKFFSLPKK